MTLRQTQERMAAAVMSPLTPARDGSARTNRERVWRAEAAKFIKPNNLLSSGERLDIYRRSYWARLTSALTEDFPGLRAVLGTRAFNRVVEAYLVECPSRSFTLRNLGSKLEAWLSEHPEYAGANHRQALDMIRLEWAHIVAFDGPQENIPGIEDLRNPGAGLRVGLQPYLSLLELQYPVDLLRVRITKGATSGRPPRLRPARIFVAVHRLSLSVYYRRLGVEEFRLLIALGAGASIGTAVRGALKGSSLIADEVPGLLQRWFATWAEFGWLCVRSGR